MSRVSYQSSSTWSPWPQVLGASRFSDVEDRFSWENSGGLPRTGMVVCFDVSSLFDSCSAWGVVSPGDLQREGRVATLKSNHWVFWIVLVAWRRGSSFFTQVWAWTLGSLFCRRFSCLVSTIGRLASIPFATWPTDAESPSTLKGWAKQGEEFATKQRSKWTRDVLARLKKMLRKAHKLFCSTINRNNPTNVKPSKALWTRKA